MNFVAYYRVSTQRQGESGLGMEAQRGQVQRYVAAIGGALVAEYTEVESGKRVTRPQLERAMDHAKKAGATLIVAKIDRLARNARYLLKLRDSGLPLTFCDLPNPPDGAVGRFMIGQMALFAEFERERISERTKSALAIAKQRGKKLGVNGKALARRNRGLADAYARRVAEKIREVNFDWQAMTQIELRTFLNAHQILTANGRPWGKTTVQRLYSRLVGLRDERDN